MRPVEYAVIFAVIFVFGTCVTGQVLHKPLYAIHELHIPFSRMVGLVYALAPILGILLWILLRQRWPVLSVVGALFIWGKLYTTEHQFAIQQTQDLVVSRALTAVERAKLSQLPFPFLEYRSDEEHIVVENRQECVDRLCQELITLQVLKPTAPGLRHTLTYGAIPYEQTSFGALLISDWQWALAAFALLPLSSVWKWHRSRWSSPALVTLTPIKPDNNLV